MRPLGDKENAKWLSDICDRANLASSYCAFNFDRSLLVFINCNQYSEKTVGFRSWSITFNRICIRCCRFTNDRLWKLESMDLAILDIACSIPRSNFICNYSIRRKSVDTYVSAIGSAERIFNMVGGYNDHHTRLVVNLSWSPLTKACTRTKWTLRAHFAGDARR